MTDDLAAALTPQYEFTLLTNHAHVLVLIAQKPDVRMREIAATVGITERAVQRIVDDLTSTGYIVVTKDGRRNRYEIQPHAPLRHNLDKHRTIGDLIRLIVPLYQGGIQQANTGEAGECRKEEDTIPNGETPPTAICASTALPCPTTLARLALAGVAVTDAPVLSAQTREDLMEALQTTPTVMAHSGELRPRKQ